MKAIIKIIQTQIILKSIQKVIMAPGYTSLTEIHCIKKYNKSNTLNIIYVA